MCVKILKLSKSIINLIFITKHNLLWIIHFLMSCFRSSHQDIASDYYQPLHDQFESLKMKAVIELCQFIENLKSADKSSPIECLCQKVLKNKEVFQKHKSTCKEFLLPEKYIYNLSSNSIETIGKFKQWYEALNCMVHKYKKRSIWKYLTPVCDSLREQNGEFILNKTSNCEKFYIHPSGFYNHSARIIDPSSQIKMSKEI